MVSMLSVFVHAANTLEVTYQIGNTQKGVSGFLRLVIPYVRNKVVPLPYGTD